MDTDRAPNDPRMDALLKLLEDDDPDVLRSLTETLARLPEERFRLVSDRFPLTEKSPCPPALAAARRRRAIAQFGRWLRAAGDDADLETGLGLIESWGRPDKPGRKSGLMLDAYASVVQERAKSAEGAEAIVPVLCRYLFEEIGFRGDSENYYDPENSYITCVLERKRGIPISLSSLVILVARRLRIEILPIGSPGHFLAAVRMNGGLKYIDGFGGGRLLTREEAIRVLPQTDPPTPDPLPVVGTREILARTLRNLCGSYAMREDRDRLEELMELIAYCE